MNSTSINEMQSIAKMIRIKLVEFSHRTKTPHLGSCLSCVEILTTIYWRILRNDPSHPQHPDRDRFILSKGHGAPALFHTLAMRGFFPYSKMDNYGCNGSLFAEHPPVPGLIPGIEAATGSLGHGLPIAVGMALAARIQKRSYRVISLLSDGECNEGSVWEAALLAAAHRLENLAVIVDYNKWQATDRSEMVMALKPLKEKWDAFGWNAFEVDGHDIEALLKLLETFPYEIKKPMAIVAHTIKGKGVSFMEDDNNWHYRIPSSEETLRAISELEMN